MLHDETNHTDLPTLVLMNEQASKLSDLIKDRCAASHAKKKLVRMLANTEKLHFYLMVYRLYDMFLYQ